MSDSELYRLASETERSPKASAIAGLFYLMTHTELKALANEIEQRRGFIFNEKTEEFEPIRSAKRITPEMLLEVADAIGERP